MPAAVRPPTPQTHRAATRRGTETVLDHPYEGFQELVADVPSLVPALVVPVACRRVVLTLRDRAFDVLRQRRERALSPAATLARGSAVVHGPAGGVVRSPDDVTSGDALRIRLAHGEIAASAH